MLLAARKKKLLLRHRLKLLLRLPLPRLLPLKPPLRLLRLLMQPLLLRPLPPTLLLRLPLLRPLPLTLLPRPLLAHPHPSKSSHYLQKSRPMVGFFVSAVFVPVYRIPILCEALPHHSGRYGQPLEPFILASNPHFSCTAPGSAAKCGAREFRCIVLPT